MSKRYHAREYFGGIWHVIGPSGFPIYDDAPYGKDKPRFFTDQDSALACAERCNLDDEDNEENDMTTDLNQLAREVHQANIKWWQDIHTGEPIERNKLELLALVHSEISEAVEGERKNLMDDKLPHRKMAEVELVDCIIRILDYAGGFGYDLQGAFEEKMAYNRTRADHTHEERRKEGGKKH